MALIEQRPAIEKKGHQLEFNRQPVLNDLLYALEALDCRCMPATLTRAHRLMESRSEDLPAERISDGSCTVCFTYNLQVYE
jgi:hypothetical protein